VVGIVTQADFLRGAACSEGLDGLAARLRKLMTPSPGVSSDKPEWWLHWPDQPEGRAPCKRQGAGAGTTHPPCYADQAIDEALPRSTGR
jgi:hypothetical protein